MIPNKTAIYIKTREENKKVQDIIFKHGIKWAAEDDYEFWEPYYLKNDTLIYSHRLCIEIDISNRDKKSVIWLNTKLGQETCLTAQQFIEKYGVFQQEFEF